MKCVTCLAWASICFFLIPATVILQLIGNFLSLFHSLATMFHMSCGGVLKETNVGTQTVLARLRDKDVLQHGFIGYKLFITKQTSSYGRKKKRNKHYRKKKKKLMCGVSPNSRGKLTCGRIVYASFCRPEKWVLM